MENYIWNEGQLAAVVRVLGHGITGVYSAPC